MCLPAVVWAQQESQPPVLQVPTVWRQESFWVGLREAGDALGFQVHYLAEDDAALVTRGAESVELQSEDASVWRNPEGRIFVPARWLSQLGYSVRWQPRSDSARVTWDGAEGLLVRQPKRIEVDLRRQRLFAYEGDVRIFQFRVSTGKLGKRTPPGQYRILSKAKLHISRTYPEPTGGARMPYAMRFYEGYFLHGYRYVSRRPASHGCIRLRMRDARTLHEWTPLGTPVRIYRSST